jgi:oxygen-independent coproporphyrinogen-3 oxidase
LYVHLPWCVSKCPYCDFNSHERPSQGIPEQDYVAAVLEDLDRSVAECGGRTVQSIFFGGGTPSLFSPESIGRLVRAAAERLGLRQDAEITLEANPGTVEHGSFAAFRGSGVNRVSLGAQSFDERKLRVLGRIHTGGETELAVRELRQAGLDNFNIDLMYGLPGQSVAEALEDLERALALGPAQVSHYQLTLEPGTPFARRPPALPDEEACYEMQLACQERLAAAGFEQYEVSAYALPGRRCGHNLNYWQFGDYLGLGAGAHGKLTDPGTGEIRRSARLRHPSTYLAARGTGRFEAETHAVQPQDLVFEFCLNALRLRDGFDRALFEARTGLAWDQLLPRLELARQRGLMAEPAPGAWVPTGLGFRFLNDLQLVFLPVSGPEPRPEGRGRCRPGANLYTDPANSRDSVS